MSTGGMGIGLLQLLIGRSAPLPCQLRHRRGRLKGLQARLGSALPLRLRVAMGDER